MNAVILLDKNFRLNYSPNCKINFGKFLINR